MKHMFQRLKSDAALEYKRPESLEDNPQDLNDFLKKNEMSGLLKKNPARETAKAESAPAEKPVEETVVVEEKSEVAKEL